MSGLMAELKLHGVVLAVVSIVWCVTAYAPEPDEGYYPSLPHLEQMTPLAAEQYARQQAWQYDIAILEIEP